MSFNKRYLPDIETLKSDYEKLGIDDFYIRHIKRVDAFIGSTEALDFVNSIIEKRSEDKNRK